jgi:hypothetical protein
MYHIVVFKDWYLYWKEKSIHPYDLLQNFLDIYSLPLPPKLRKWENGKENINCISFGEDGHE